MQITLERYKKLIFRGFIGLFLGSLRICGAVHYEDLRGFSLCPSSRKTNCKYKLLNTQRQFVHVRYYMASMRS